VRRVQVIVESHSEHLLRRLQRRVAEEKLSKSDVELYFADLQDGDSVLTRLDLNIFGEIENWPSGFFGDQLGEAAALTKAGIQRRGST
jgi:predicted ATPase